MGGEEGKGFHHCSISIGTLQLWGEPGQGRLGEWHGKAQGASAAVEGTWDTFWAFWAVLSTKQPFPFDEIFLTFYSEWTWTVGGKMQGIPNASLA